MADWKDLSVFLKGILNSGPAGNGCAVARGGEILFEEYHGLADVEKGKPVDASSVFRQYSTTKIVTCTAAMMLYEKGKFLLNDPIYEYFPEWRHTQVAEKQPDSSVIVRDAARPILVRDCFSMSMGIGYGGDDLTHRTLAKVRERLRDENPNYSLRDDIRAMAEVPLAFDPGTHWLYGVGHELVAGLIEVVSGIREEEFLRTNLFEPLGMSSTGHHFFGDIQERLVKAYTWEEGVRKPLGSCPGDDRLSPESEYDGGGAGLFSTVRDYLKLSQMLALGGTYKGERILGRKTIDLMRLNQLNEQQLQDFTFPYVEGYGYGLGVRTMINRAAGVNSSDGEFGWTGMMGTYVEMDPAEELSIVYMHSLSPNQEAYIHPRIRNIVYGLL